MDKDALFTRFNRTEIEDRQVDTMIGIAKGLIADDVVNSSEAAFLHQWLVESRGLVDNPMIQNLLQKLAPMLDDGVLDNEEATDLLSVLRGFAGSTGAVGEVQYATTLPLCNPPPDVRFEGASFVFTGTFVFGRRKECEAVVVDRGGVSSSNVTQATDYLVIGRHVTDSWKHESFGRKIEKAVRYRSEGARIAIVSEQHWLDSAGV